VVTDVGDSRSIVEDTGIVILPKDAQALANGWEKILEMSKEERHALGEKARKRIQENYSLEIIVKQYESIYETYLKPNDH